MVALQRVFLWEKVSKLTDKLETDATNCFTMGERKMMFLARVILRNTVKVSIQNKASDCYDTITELKSCTGKLFVPIAGDDH